MFGDLDKFSLPEFEKEVTKFWEENHIFEKTLEKTTKGKPYSFYDGPPFATGLPHYGHILASTIKDVIPRYQTMKGRFVRRRWGWDCHGLPIEEIVERGLGISGKKDIEEKIGVAKFNETCCSTVLQYVSEWRKMIRRMGRWIDFDNSYKTMDRDYMESVWWAFKELYKKGLVYEGRKVLLYCPRCETPVSNFEVAMDNSYKTITEESVIAKFKISPNNESVANKRINELRKGEDVFLLAWTTTPWTLPGNVALAVNPDVVYCNFQFLLRSRAQDRGAISNFQNNEFFIIAKERLKTLAVDYKIVSEFLGKDLVGLEYESLFQTEGIAGDPKAHRVYAADFVTTDEGTGIVHIATAYGEDDYNLGLKEGLPVAPMLDERGHFNEKAPEFLRGAYFEKANKLVIEDLGKRGLMFPPEKHEHSYPHCWRCSNKLFYNAIPAWFVNVGKIKKDLLKSNEKEINWYPEHLKFGRYAKSVEAAPDWNISRNRYWGNPIPVWRCEKCKKDIVVGSVKELGVDLEDLHRPYIDEVILKCECGGEARRVPEIFDSWMEAGSMPFAEYHYPFDEEQKKIFTSRYPAQFVAEYIAQTRAWFYVMHVLGLSLFGKAPFLSVVTTGTILAEDGSKMSKSKNNFPDPWVVIEKYGVDSLRFYLMNSVVMQAENLNFSVKDLETGYRKVVTILWNCFQYLRTYGTQAEWRVRAKGEKANSANALLDKWISVRTNELVSGVTEGLEKYDTVRATRAIADYVNDLSTWYVRRSRGRTDSAFFSTLYDALLTTSKAIAPFMPHLAEIIYKNLVELFGGVNMEESVHLQVWPKTKKISKEDRKFLADMEVIRSIASKALAKRSEAGIPVRQPLQKLKVKSFPSVLSSGSKEKLKVDSVLLEILKEEVNVREIVFDESIQSDVDFDTTITEELRREGMIRALRRLHQEERKNTGFCVGEAIQYVVSEETHPDIVKILEDATKGSGTIVTLRPLDPN
ncbi:MAG: isoleucine--tRNA ligase, partial [Nanoarchaeota archaeon]|nr:isoleucine--tRNA ligase [Nanoarchaeota archaeon]